MNAGALVLRKKLEAHGAKAQLARDVSVGLDVVSRWVNGERTPNTKQRAELEDRLGISWRIWDDEVPEAPRPPGTDGGGESHG